MKDPSNATSPRVLDCQHFASSKFAPSLDVKTLTSPRAYAQSAFKPNAARREFRTPVHVTPHTWADCGGERRGEPAVQKQKAIQQQTPRVFATWVPPPSLIHWRGPAAQQMLGNLPDCLLNMCCLRWRRQMPHTAAALLLPMQGQNTMPTISACGFPINTSAGEGMPDEETHSSRQIVCNCGRKTYDKPAAPDGQP